MKLRVFDDPRALAFAAARHAAKEIRCAIAERGTARILASASESQVEFLGALVREPAVPWSEVELFQVDEYAGLATTHPASIRKFLFDHLIHPAQVGRYHMLDGENGCERVCRDIGQHLAAQPVDIAFAAIGDNGRLGVHEPPADFNSETPYSLMRLDEGFRRQRVNDGAFGSLADVPFQAISLSVRQLLKARVITCCGSRACSAEAVKRIVEGPPLTPSSILRSHADATLYLEVQSAALLAVKPDVE
jgi:glucosamine-6-phosphate deaminase